MTIEVFQLLMTQSPTAGDLSAGANEPANIMWDKIGIVLKKIVIGAKCMEAEES